MLLAFLFVGSLSAAERVVEISELPPSVRQSLENSVRGEKIERITVRNAGGRVVYDAESTGGNASAKRLRFAADGTVLGDAPETTEPTEASAGAPSTAADPDTVTGTPVTPFGQPDTYPAGYPYEPYMLAPPTPKVNLEDLPKPARAAVRREAADRPIASITEVSLDGRKVYVARFRDSGRNPRVFVAEDGAILRPTEKPPLLFGTTFADTPEPVQRTIRRELGEGEIVKIDRQKENSGEPESYVVEAKDSRGEYRLRVATDGRLLENSRRRAGDAADD